jgi:hypothetical protein
MSHKKTSNFHQILRNLTVELRDGDSVTIWHDGYQVHYKNVGTSNFKVKTSNNNQKKNATKDTI